MKKTILAMFGLENKKKRSEFIQSLSELGNISEIEAERYYDKNESTIKQAFSRGLDSLSAVMYISENNMEKIQAAHHLGDLSLISDIPDYFLLVSLSSLKAMQRANVPSNQLALMFNYWHHVVDLPINPKKPNFTYGDRLQGLVEDYNKVN